MALSASLQIECVSIKETEGSRLDNQTSKSRRLRILEKLRLEGFRQRKCPQNPA